MYGHMRNGSLHLSVRDVPHSKGRRRSTALAVVLAGTLIPISACGSSEPADPTAADGASPSSPLTMLDPAESAAVLALDDIRIIDVRTPQEFAEGHIAGAELIDIAQPDFAERIAALDRDATYFVYCRSDNRSGVATEMMLEMGFTSMYELRGGTIAWQQAGLPLVAG